MTKIVYPHRLRAIRVREDMVLITAKNAPVGAWEDILLCGDKGLLLGSPQNGWLRLAVPAPPAKEIFPGETAVITPVRVIDVYGMEMRGMCIPLLQTLEDMKQRVLGVSLSTQRLSAAVQGEYPDLSVLCSRFPMEI